MCGYIFISPQSGDWNGIAGLTKHLAFVIQSQRRLQPAAARLFLEKAPQALYFMKLQPGLGRREREKHSDFVKSGTGKKLNGSVISRCGWPFVF